MKINKFLFCSFLISSSAFASFEGEYEKISGPETCPEGRLYFKELKDEKEKVLIFGVKHSWVFSLDAKITQMQEAGDESSCSYDYSYVLTENMLDYKTKRAKCPTLEENASVEESFRLTKQLLTYSFKSTSEDKKSENFECRYKKKK